MKYLLYVWLTIFIKLYPYVWGEKSLEAASRFRARLRKQGVTK